MQNSVRYTVKKGRRTMEKAERRLRVPARGAIWYTGISFATKSVGMLTTPFFTRLLGVHDYGIYSLYMSVLGVLSVGLSEALRRHSLEVLPRQKSRDRRKQKHIQLLSQRQER